MQENMYQNWQASSRKTTRIIRCTSIWVTLGVWMPRIIGGYDPCLDDYAKSYYNKHDVQKALHFSEGHHMKNLSICNMDIFHGWKDSKESVLPIYSGDTDGRVPVLSTRYSLNTLVLPINRSWRPWYHKKQIH